MHPLATYLQDVQLIHQSGSSVKETSFYPALSTLFNALGKPLKPPVYCVSILKNVGAGFPDGGFFTKSQNQTLEKETDAGKKQSLLQSTKPERGVLEVKGVAQDLTALIASNQVKKYLDEYGLVLVCNLREFALVDCKDGAPREIERFTLCDDAAKFWTLSPSKTAEDWGEECAEFLTRCLLTGAPLRTPQDVATFLASYARQSRLRLESAALETLLPLKTSLEAALGIEFKAAEKPGQKLSEAEKRERGERFFRATLVQTLFYGLFSAWLGHVEKMPAKPFDWRLAQYELHVPMVAELFEQLVQKSSMKSLGLENLLELATETLNRVAVAEFFQKWGDAGAIQYFYEPFLERFDPQLRRELGVYYTPPEIVRYMVERVHTVLQTELGLEDGLAHPDVVVLDPCCGTGAYPLAVLGKIAEVLHDKGLGITVGEELKQISMERVIGFEILPAPFVVAHHGIAALLAHHGAFYLEGERAKIVLTNSLTGWENELKTGDLWAGFKDEVTLAHWAKQNAKILVIIGNPPYDAFTEMDKDDALVKPYKDGLQSEWGIKKFNLDDLYVRFFRIAERRLAAGDKGILCFISNYSWTSEPSFVQMRRSLLANFDEMWIENMHGNRNISERAPDGTSSETVFAMAGFSPGIRQGITISTLVRRDETRRVPQAKVHYRDDLNDARAADRREALLESLSASDFNAQYQSAAPEQSNRFSLRPQTVAADYAAWPQITEFSKDHPALGILENRKDALISTDREALKERMLRYYDEKLSFEELDKLGFGFTKNFARFEPMATRKKVLAAEKFDENSLQKLFCRPFDFRWCYYTTVRPLWNEYRPTFAAQRWEGNRFFASRKTRATNPEGPMFYEVSGFGAQHALHTDAYFFPFQLRREVIESLEADELGQMQEKTRTETVANLSAAARAYLADLGLAEPDASAGVAALLWRHALAIGYSRAYRLQHGDGIAADWPRVPLPSDASLLESSAVLGGRVAALLDVAAPVAGIESGTLRTELRPLGALSKLGDEKLSVAGGDLRVSASWGYFGGRGEVMAQSGKIIERAPDASEKAALETLDLGGETSVLDVYLNERVYWKAVPRAAWDCTIGGYPVMKKWLSYRDERVLGRALSLEESREVEAMTRRLTTLASLQVALDANYQACAANCRPLRLEAGSASQKTQG